MTTVTLEITECLNCLYKDLNMLLDDSWVPDYKSTADSIDQIERLADLLFVELEPYPEER